MQRRHQKVVERARRRADRGRAPDALRAALALARAAGYTHAGTVDSSWTPTPGVLFHRGQPAPSGRAHRHRGGHRLSTSSRRSSASPERGSATRLPAVPPQEAITLSGHALQCRVTTGGSGPRFAPAHGRLDRSSGPAGFGIRSTPGRALSPALWFRRSTTPYSMKMTAWGDTPEATIGAWPARCGRRDRGVASNLSSSSNVIAHPPSLRAPARRASSTRHQSSFDNPRQ